MKGATRTGVLESKRHAYVRVSIYTSGCRGDDAVADVMLGYRRLSARKITFGVIIRMLLAQLFHLLTVFWIDLRCPDSFFFRSLSLSLSPARFKTIEREKARERERGRKELKLNQSLLTMWGNAYVILNKPVSSQGLRTVSIYAKTGAGERWYFMFSSINRESEEAEERTATTDQSVSFYSINSPTQYV